MEKAALSPIKVRKKGQVVWVGKPTIPKLKRGERKCRKTHP